MLKKLDWINKKYTLFHNIFSSGKLWDKK
nr:ribosomal protein L22 [Filipendula multijuga]YP_010727019.1 ribosomal protein L22 [Filipendula palmata]YP_010727099.1 ribosomal protein L22 [Filipendula vestita]YP_010727179.1 ribosomal protein L22 [Filipendula intermedia]YP_010727259.1 ribosomal protein L22 [Filipendula nuda]YP_010727339.1 ribosomal protein L22 [Filipendula ulmaria]YP_010727419.1 ribosomal protein L22 [Filipendula angustiloba]WDZ66549.1 ribosomal protein L22 [Filipendula multijuga]WDZ66629.1 ribosomal protein L22 [Filip